MNGDQHLHNPERRNPGSDDALRDRFTMLRREEEQQAPEFASLWRRTVRAPRSKKQWRIAAACLLIMVAAVLWLRSTQRRNADFSVASITDWKAPTDFLLETPGRELLRTVPEIGGWRGYTGTAMPQARPSQLDNKVLH